ncbi:cobalamin-binding protein [Stutzerimonas azotifigens]|uniref:Cobalamin-binding protein n=1 Tax=Stutzerimonas azotifigens TaxID=291995 RepID=A0ABR5Z5S7_9GAMM|nr:cobalamin-binding protein [Stutzerimonas azotifigens]MBA1275570.1 cobalamin-binding protein [Stutzerimonas azotifigens]
MRTRLLLSLALLGAFTANAAERVVSLAPSMSEVMLELGAGELLVGVLDGGERPAVLAGIPSVGRYGKLELETLLSLQPDLILLWPDSISSAQREQLAGFGIPLYQATPRRLDDLADQLEAIGGRIGRAEAGRMRAARLRERLARLRERYRRAPPVPVFYQIWDEPLYTIGGTQVISDALATCGARNLFDDLRLPAPQVGIEAVLARDPAVILTSEPNQRDAWKRWPQLTAVRRDQVWAVPDRGLERPSLQMLDATERLCERLENARSD